MNICGKYNKKCNILFILILFIILLIALFYSVNTIGEFNSQKVYDGDFCEVPGIIAGAEMYSEFKGRKILNIRVKNISDKKIKRISIYFMTENHNEETKKDFVEIYDDIIEVGTSEKYVYEFTEAKTSEVDVYIYNIHYEDGSEWGNVNASKESILKESYKVNIVNFNEKY